MALNFQGRESFDMKFYYISLSENPVQHELRNDRLVWSISNLNEGSGRLLYGLSTFVMQYAAKFSVSPSRRSESSKCLPYRNFCTVGLGNGNLCRRNVERWCPKNAAKCWTKSLLKWHTLNTSSTSGSNRRSKVFSWPSAFFYVNDFAMQQR